MRRLALALIGLNMVVLTTVWVQGHRVSASSAPETLRARAIELVDERGQVRAQLNVEPNGEAVFRLRDSAGEVRVKLGASKDGSGLVLLNGATEPGVHMLAKGRETSLTLTNHDGQRRLITP